MYTTADSLGSPRINTDGTGQVVARHDDHPFGKEIARSGYGSDTIRKRFTGYERDGEAGLDFAQARYFQSSHGRFSSPDPLAASANPIRPQSWNRYIYVFNNPYRFSDPTGMSAVGDYYDEQGTKIGSDGVSDNKKYLVANEKDQKLIKQNPHGELI